ncbi:MAG: hypothetical protein HKN33_13050 [Pyrinomonadaceae bacterium]|nr:hypothetical protein [Pyrinomonadaceae bacterium]
MRFLFAGLLLTVFCSATLFAQGLDSEDMEKVNAVVAKALQKLGGEKYKGVSTLSSSGKLSILEGNKISSFQSFVDIIVYPDKERTDFAERGSRTVQVNTGNTGWIYDELFENFGAQTEKQLENFKRGRRAHYDFLLRGNWREEAKATYEGRRVASLGKRNDVVRLTFEDEFWVEYEFSDNGLPSKTVYPSVNSDGVEIKEENRYAQFILRGGILFPFIVDHFTDGKHSYRVNYVKVQFNRPVKDSIFVKPSSPKKIKKLKVK